MNKRGSEFRLIFIIASLLLAVSVVLIFTFRTRDVLESEAKVEAYSKNMALTINALLYSDYDQQVTFKIDKDYEVSILSDKLVVSFGDYSREYSFIPDNNFKVISERQKDGLIFRKVKNGRV